MTDMIFVWRFLFDMFTKKKMTRLNTHHHYHPLQFVKKNVWLVKWWFWTNGTTLVVDDEHRNHQMMMTSVDLFKKIQFKEAKIMMKPHQDIEALEIFFLFKIHFGWIEERKRNQINPTHKKKDFHFWIFFSVIIFGWIRFFLKKKEKRR